MDVDLSFSSVDEVDEVSDFDGEGRWGNSGARGREFLCEEDEQCEGGFWVRSTVSVQ